ncbi:tyrosine-type recombinase/integrase [Tetragenococcus muriaticus]|uniref:tyrosine-type recombinase/integrase n=1 Tax=Tetragenococcus muriaticus TaxID=64642 RepID=UPI0024540C12|nr:tyrosine-type recombinase/integrase [Tetragenococcus muriaticus]
MPQTVANLFRQYQKDQAELQEFLGDAYNDYNLVFALDNGNPVESRIIRDRLKLLCDGHGFERVDFHSLRHLSTKYKLKMTQGDIKSVQGDTGHTEAEMVTNVYAEIVDEDRRFNAQKLEEAFYHNLGKAKTSEISSTELSETDKQLIALIKKLPSELKENLLKDS